MVVGESLGPYHVLAKLGEGGMGEVYKARDTKLGRSVALKILPATFAADAERLARFEREARTLATLNHPHIAQVYGVEDSAGSRALVMELVEGEDLAQRLGRGPLPVDEALAIARQIVDALEAAHEAGIVHRDLKPANVKVRPDGTTKVLDFGLAKAVESKPSEIDEMVTSPIITSPAGTMAGAILGTAAYMAPEQAKGKPVDKRADIWAFGCVLYELLTARRPFPGEDLTDTIVSVVSKEPDWSLLPKSLPPAVGTLLRRCLEKDPRVRLRDIGDARSDLNTTAAPETPPPSPARSWTAAAAAATVALILGAAGGWLAQPGPEPEPLRQLDVFPRADDIAFVQERPQFSPDGRHILIPAGPSWTSTNRRLTVRNLAETSERDLPGTSDVDFAGWSPDSAEVAWVARGRLWRMPLAGNQPSPIATVPISLAGGGSLLWLEDGRILLAGSHEALLFQVPATGGTVRPFVTINPDVDRDFHQAAIIYGRRKILVARHLVGGATDRIDVLDTDSGQATEVIRFKGEVVGSPAWSPTGHVLFERSRPDASIWALPIDVAAGRATGEPFMLVPAAGMPSTDAKGRLSYVRGGRRVWRQLVWVDRTGQITGTIGRSEPMLDTPAVDPSGARVLAVLDDPQTLTDLWVWDTARGARTPVATDPSFEFNPAWTAEGGMLWGVNDRSEIVYRGVGEREGRTIAAGWYPHAAPRGQTYVVSQLGVKGNYDLVVGTIGGSPAQPLIASGADEYQPRISPDGRLLAYMTIESGRQEIFVDGFPEAGQRLQISTGDGHTPRWGPKGLLYYIAGGQLMEARVSGSPPSLAAAPAPLFALAASGLSGSYDSFDIDGAGRLLMLRMTPRPEGPPVITVVTGLLPALSSKSGTN
jgi:serine/threonine protein kinase